MITVAHRARRLLDMGFEEPEVLVDTARDLSEEVRRAGIARLVGVVDILADGVRIDRITVDECREMVCDPVSVEGVWRELRAGGHCGCSTACGTAELCDALGNLVVVVVEFGAAS